MMNNIGNANPKKAMGQNRAGDTYLEEIEINKQTMIK